MPSRPQRSTKNSRINTLGSLYVGNGQPNPSTLLAPGHDQGLFNPHFSVESVRQGRVLMSPMQPAMRIHREHQQQYIQQENTSQHNTIAGLKLLLVGTNDCYARTTFQFLVPLEVRSQGIALYHN